MPTPPETDQGIGHTSNTVSVRQNTSDAEDNDNQNSEQDDDNDHGRSGLINYLVHRHFLSRLENNGGYEGADGEDTVGNDEMNHPPAYEDAVKDEIVVAPDDDE